MYALDWGLALDCWKVKSEIDIFVKKLANQLKDSGLFLELLTANSCMPARSPSEVACIKASAVVSGEGLDVAPEQDIPKEAINSRKANITILL